MHEKTILKQVKKALSDPETRNYADQYLERVRVNMQKTEDKVRRSFVILFLLLALFELLTRSAIAELTLGPFKLKDFSLIYKLLPVAIAYCYCEFHGLLTMRRLLRETHDVIMENIHKPIFENNLCYYLLPSSIFIAEEVITSATEGLWAKIIHSLSIPLFIILIFSPLVFEVYALHKCFVIWGVTDVLVWIVLFVSLTLLLQGFLFFFHISKLTGLEAPVSK